MIWYAHYEHEKRHFTSYLFIGSIAAAPIVAAVAQTKQIPVGLELYSVRDDLQKDLMGTVRGVAKMGYQCVEFYAPYYAWTTEYARQVRAELMNSASIATRLTTG